MIVYIDSNFKCHTTNDGTMTPVEEEFFDYKCKEFIEGYCLKPDNMVWVLDSGEILSDGKIITNFKPYSELNLAQQKYDREQLDLYRNQEVELNTSYQEGINSI